MRSTPSSIISSNSDAREADGAVHLTDEQRNDGFGVERERLFGLDALAAQRRESDARGGVGCQSGCGQPRGRDRVPQHDVVEVRPAEVGDAERLADDAHRAVVVLAQDDRVEGAAAEVVDGEGVTGLRAERWPRSAAPRPRAR